MTLVQTEPKSIKIGSTNIKRVTIRPNGTEKQIRPVQWTPGANTIAYYPLTSTSTVNDMSGNNRTLTTAHSLPTFGTYQGVDCAYFNGSNECGVSNTSNNVVIPTFTISFWLYSSSGGDRPVWSNVSYASNKYYGFGIRAHPVWNNVFRLDGCFSTLSSGNNGWHHLLFTYDNRSEICYVDGVQNATGSFTGYEPNSNQAMKIGCGYDEQSGYYAYYQGGLSEFILENKVRTAQEVSDYYDLTKGNYGIQALNNSLSNTFTQTITLTTPNSGTGDILTI